VSGVELELRVAWQRHLGSSAVATQWFDEVLGAYRAEGRHYHGIRHVAWVVRHVETIAADHPLDDLSAAVAAAFFHDVVYDTLRHDNEAESGAMAQRAVREIGWPEEVCRHVAELVLATAGHDVQGVDRDTAVLLAADLAVLAAEPSRYSDYAIAVRREYAHIDEAGWRSGRGAVLRSLLDRPNLFAPELGLDEWERRARANLTSELASLSGGG
jgi:predicted metal-dependent HD superfamily phosphohydrolase